MTDDNNSDVTSEEEDGSLAPSNGSPADEAELDDREDVEETSDSGTGLNDAPKISDSVEDLKNQLNRLSDKIDSQFVREQKDIKQMQKQMTVSLSAVISLSVISILIAVFSWFSQRGEQSIAENLGERIESFTLMDSLIEDLQKDLNLAGIDSDGLVEQLLGFQNTLDIAIEQISLSLDEKIGLFDQKIEGLKASVAGFDDTFDAFGDTNLAMSTEIRRVIQSNARLEEFEETLQALILLEKEKYYDLVTAQLEIQAVEVGEEDETAGSMNVDENGYIFFSQD